MPSIFNGAALREKRESRNMTREQLAVRLDRSAMSVVRYELGMADPPLRVAAHMAQILGVSVFDLLHDLPGAAVAQ